MPEFTVRLAREADWSQLHLLLLNPLDPLDSLEAAFGRYQGKLHSSLHCIFVAEIDGQIVGYAMAHEWDCYLMSGRKQIRFSTLEVLPAFKRRGIGTALFMAARDWAEGIGATWFEWYASLEAVPFYEKLGYQGSGDPDVRHPYFEHDFTKPSI